MVEKSKKKIKCLSYIVFIIVLTVVLNSCKPKPTNYYQADTAKESTSNSIESNQKSICEGNKEKVISEGKNFEVLDISKGTERKYRFCIYDSNSKIVDQDEVERMEPLISYVDGTTLEIRFNGGTNATCCQYYDTSNNTFSQQFWNPALTQNRLIVYMNGSDKDIKLVVQNIFDSNLFYREYVRDFTPVSMPETDLENVKFIDKDHIEITYLEGVSSVKQTEIIDLGKK